MASSVGNIVSTVRLALSYLASVSTGRNASYVTNVSSSSGNISNGTGANQANRLLDTTQTIAASGTYTLDVTSATDPLNNAVALTRVTEILIQHLSTSAASSITAGGGSNPVITSYSVTLKPGGKSLPFSDYSATALAISTNKNIKILNNDGTNSATVRITVVGSQ